MKYKIVKHPQICGCFFYGERRRHGMSTTRVLESNCGKENRIFRRHPNPPSIFFMRDHLRLRMVSRIIKGVNMTTKKQRLWNQYYESGQSPSQAAKSAGYGGSYTKMGCYNLKQYQEDQALKSQVGLPIESKVKNYEDDVADMEEITAFWTSILRDEHAELRDKLKVSELLAKIGRGADDVEADHETEGVEAMSLREKLKIIDRIKQQGETADE